MKSYNRISAVAAVAFAAGLSFSLVACDNSSLAKAEDVPESSSAVQESSSSNEPESSSGTVPESSASLELDSAYCDSVTRKEMPYTCDESLEIDGVYYRESGFMRPEASGCTYKCQNNKWTFVPAGDIPATEMVVSDYDRLAELESARMLHFKKCNSENEGLVESLATNSRNPKGGTGYDYYRCEQGSWVERPAWVKCDTAGVTEGALCRLQTYFRGIQFGEDTWNCYKYAGNGSWNDVDCPTEPEKECNEENKDAKEKIAFTNDSLFYKCSGSKWIEIDLAEGNDEVSGLECDAESEGVLDSSWSENNPKYGKMMYYRCESGSWVERDQWVTCDMEGVAKGDTCRKIEHKGSFYQYPKERVFVYEGDGAWKELPSEQPQNDFPDCSDFKDGDETLYCPTDEVCDDMKHYVCKDGTWTLAEAQK